MIETPRLTDSARELAAVIRLTVPRSDMQAAFVEAVHELLDVLKAQGNPPIGPPWAFHFRLDPEVFDFEIGFPVGTPVTPDGRIEVGELPAASRVVRTVYHGPYQGLPAAWREFGSWIETEGIAVADAFWERYVLGPESTEDPQAYRTELNRIVAEGT